MIEDFDLGKEEREFSAKMLKGTKVARANNMSLTKFKTEIEKGLLTTNDEDQWTFDYQSFLGAISNGIYESPTEWGKEYFNGRWSLD